MSGLRSTPHLLHRSLIKVPGTRLALRHICQIALRENESALQSALQIHGFVI